MSNWVHLEITVNKESKVSVKKVVKDVWESASISKEPCPLGKRDTFFVGNPDCGVSMLEDIKLILESIKQYDNKANPYICIERCVIY